jgi:phosphomethylpyrimidine synthase
MTVQAKPNSVTTGPIIGSQKIYSAPVGHPDILVPFREVLLHPTAKEPPLQLYDTSGPYTESGVLVDLDAGLPQPRAKCRAGCYGGG